MYMLNYLCLNFPTLVVVLLKFAAQPVLQHLSMNFVHYLPVCVFLLVVGSELCSLDLPLGCGVDVGTGVVVPDPMGVCGAASPIVGMGLNLVRLNPISVKSSMFLSLDSDSWRLILDSFSISSLWIICISLCTISASPWAVCKIILILLFSSSSHVGTYLGDGTCGKPSRTW